MLPSMLGIINATNDLDNFKNLVSHRSLAVLPFGGRYRLIDFMLSNMVNSGIHNVAIFTGIETRSLMDQLGSGKHWDLNRSIDGLFVFTPPKDKFWRDDFAHIERNLSYFSRSKQEYVVITNCYTLGSLNYTKILTHHIETNADITEVFQSGKSLRTFIMKKDLLLSIYEQFKNAGYYKMLDAIREHRHKFKLSNYEYKDYIAIIDSIQSYYNHSMELLNPVVREQIFKEEEPIFTKIMDAPTTKYKKDSKVSNSMVASGCIIEGEVENSIIFRSVKIGKGSVIRNSIIMQKSQIAENCVLEGVILDKEVKIENGVHLKGSADSPYVISKGTVINEKTV